MKIWNLKRFTRSIWKIKIKLHNNIIVVELDDKNNKF